MPKNYLDRRSVIPLYHQLAEVIKKQIISGVYHPGDLLPSESKLVEDFGVSRTTVRLAMDSIKEMGLVLREQGKGTFVTSSRLHSRFPVLSSFTEEVELLGRTPGTVLVEACDVEAPLLIAEALQLEPGRQIHRIIRLRTADDKPICLATSWLNDIRFPQLRKLDYAQLSIYDLFENILGLTILRAVQHIWADISTPSDAKILEISTGAPLLRLTRNTFVASDQDNGSPIEYVEAAFIGQMYRVESELYRPRRT